MNASIRHMHREHSAYSNPTCALRAPFASHTFHSCFDLCRARERNTRPPNEHSTDNPNVLMQLCKDFLSNSENYGSYLLFQKLFTLAQPFSWSPLPLRLSATLSYV